MMATPIYEALPEILDTAYNKLQAAKVPSGLLEDVDAIHVGPRTNNMKYNKNIVIQLTDAEIDDEFRKIDEKWYVSLMVYAFINGKDSYEAVKECMELGARARNILLQDKRLGLDYVYDIKTTGFGLEGGFDVKSSVLVCGYELTITLFSRE